MLVILSLDLCHAKVLVMSKTTSAEKLRKLKFLTLPNIK